MRCAGAPGGVRAKQSGCHAAKQRGATRCHAAALHSVRHVASPRALPLLIDRVRMRAAGLLQTSAQAARRAARAPEPSRACCSEFLRPSDDVAARAAASERRDVSCRRARCPCRCAGIVAAIAACRSTTISSSYKGAHPRGSRAGWEGRGRGGVGWWLSHEPRVHSDRMRKAGRV